MSYLAVTKSKGHSYYKIMESYRDETGKVKHRVIFNIGTVADLYDLLPETVRNGKFKDESPPIANVHEPSIDSSLFVVASTALPICCTEFPIGLVFLN